MENNQNQGLSIKQKLIVHALSIITFGALIGIFLSWLNPKPKDYIHQIESNEPAFTEVLNCIDGNFATNPRNTVEISETRDIKTDKVLSTSIRFFIYGSEYQGPLNCSNTILYTMDKLKDTDIVINDESSISFTFSDSPYSDYRTFSIYYTINTSKLNRDKLGFGNVNDYAKTNGYRK